MQEDFDAAASSSRRERSPARETRDRRDDRDRDRDRYDDRRDSRNGDRDRRGPPPPSSYRGPRNQPPSQPNNVVGVFGLSLNTQERDLEDEFGRSGKVEKVTIVYDQRSQRSRGFGFVVMRDTADATRAIEDLNGIDLHGRRIRVDYSTTQKPHQPTPGQYMGIVPRDDGRGPPPRRDDDRRDARSRYDERDREYGRPPPPSRDDYDDRRRSARDDSPPRRRRSPSPSRRDRSPPRESSRYGGEDRGSRY